MDQVKWLSIILSIYLQHEAASLHSSSPQVWKRNNHLLHASPLPEVQDTSSKGDEESDISALTALAGNTAQCLISSDLKRKGGGDGGGSTGWTSWVEEKTAYKLQCCVDIMSLSLPVRTFFMLCEGGMFTFSCHVVQLSKQHRNIHRTQMI